MSGPGKTALIMAGGTGGHIFPALALAQALHARGWRVHWLGAPGAMEARVAAQHGFVLEPVQFSGLRGKGPAALALLPLRLLRAFWQALRVLRRLRPDVLLGLGGYISFPGALMGVLCGKPLLLHEQNAVAGLANRVLAGVADRVFSAFPGVRGLRNALWVGNPLRPEFFQQPAPQQRFAGRSGPLRLLVVGGSLGARALNELVPRALALLAAGQRPLVTHQSGAAQIDALRANYAAAGVAAELLAFIDDMAGACAAADLIVCRAGAGAVTEIAAVGAAALFVPFPAAVDDHQSANARHLVDAGAGWLVQQRDLTPQWLAHLLSNMERSTLLEAALKAKNLQKTQATQQLVAACEELARR